MGLLEHPAWFGPLPAGLPADLVPTVHSCPVPRSPPSRAGWFGFHTPFGPGFFDALVIAEYWRELSSFAILLHPLALADTPAYLIRSA